MSDVLDAGFVRAMGEMFGDEAEGRLGKKTFAHLRKVWDRGRLEEREAVFTFMRADPQSAQCEDKEWANQISWVIGNGTYLTKSNLDLPLSWATVEETVIIEGAIKDHLQITRVPNDIGAYTVISTAGFANEVVATIYVEEDEKEIVSHRVVLRSIRSGADQTRIYQTWEQCIHAIVAWVRMRQ